MKRKIIQDIINLLLLVSIVIIFGYFLLDEDKIYNLLVISVSIAVILRLIFNFLITLFIKDEKKQKLVELISSIILLLLWILLIFNDVPWKQFSIYAILWIIDIIHGSIDVNRVKRNGRSI